jgi:hypothetical protein
MEIIYLYVMEIDDIFIRQSTLTYLYVMEIYDIFIRQSILTYLYVMEIYYIHDKITAIWFVKRSAIISLIALSRTQGVQLRAVLWIWIKHIN